MYIGNDAAAKYKDHVLGNQAAGIAQFATRVDVPKAEPEVQGQLNMLEKALHNLQEETQMLVGRLEPVRVPAPCGVGAGETSAGGGCYVSQRLVEMRRMADSIAGALRSARDELAI